MALHLYANINPGLTLANFFARYPQACAQIPTLLAPKIFQCIQVLTDHAGRPLNVKVFGSLVRPSHKAPSPLSAP
ncbi:hypothetical protein PtA15_3A541 [Puccinia triticina]|uniref:Uncharacterized protein n=1 Tax=Puccinia triticina TaxID=208348 RepID=A0ABY7CK33_9BASI|nr:uncharacterized protein PtA15_3A541 [Puccinia triticina]WAQ83172.1 hypothetical protein PtA15_3A541 [Puccinia triticina]WAR54017.1 hypothetical protein PtB15_3B527 [Puccinia triticina]